MKRVILRVVRTRVWEARRCINRKIAREAAHRLQIERSTVAETDVIESMSQEPPIDPPEIVDRCVLCDDGADEEMTEWLECTV